MNCPSCGMPAATPNGVHNMPTDCVRSLRFQVQALQTALNLAQAHERELTALLVKAWDKQGRLGAECAMRLEWQKKAIAIMLEYRENDANRGDDANITGDVVVCECKTCARAEALIALAVSDIGWWE